MWLYGVSSTWLVRNIGRSFSCIWRSVFFYFCLRQKYRGLGLSLSLQNVDSCVLLWLLNTNIYTCMMQIFWYNCCIVVLGLYVFSLLYLFLGLVSSEWELLSFINFLPLFHELGNNYRHTTDSSVYHHFPPSCFLLTLLVYVGHCRHLLV